MAKQELSGHVSPDTAYLVADYPYGFRLRTEIRYWIETKKGHGQRVMSQTRNPKRAGMPWNAPKGSTYSPIKALYLDSDTGHVESAGLNGYTSEEKIAEFVAEFPRTAADERNQKTIQVLIAQIRASTRVTWTVTSGDSSEPRQTPEEQATILRKLTILELHKLTKEQE